MYGNSTEVESSQTDIHPQLTRIVAKHLRTPYLRPIAAHTASEYARVRERIIEAMHSGVPIVLDSCCGTGESSYRLAELHQGSFVIGFDRSLHRLSKTAHHSGGETVLLLRGAAEDVWRLLALDGICINTHYLLYPNPSPKPHHLLRRWHAHPVFPTLLRISTRIELRTNWRIYAEEFAAALRIANRTAYVHTYNPTSYLSPFESKYHASGHTLWRVVTE
ncbi:MAG: SAM-dependent methyltransferase [Candidatus Kapabacteria bacterium]|nr:SAM-dependent methyltransferase [Candidatus Kapabacteria bacterium]